MDLSIILTLLGIIVALIIGGWQILLARKQMYSPTKANYDQLTQSQIVNMVKWQKTADLFWLPHDLMKAREKLIRNKLKDEILQELIRATHHMDSLGLEKMAIRGQLDNVRIVVNNSSDKDLTRAKRQRLAVELSSIIKYIGTLAEVHQPDFIPYPDQDHPPLLQNQVKDVRE